MKHTPKTSGYHTPTISVPQPGGAVLLKSGKPVAVDAVVSISEAAQILQMSPRWVLAECVRGYFKTAYQTSSRAKGKWRISRDEVMARIPDALRGG